MGLTKEMEQRLFEMVVFSKNVEAVLSKTPKMELVVTGNKSIGTFDLKAYNKGIVKKMPLLCHR